jgi:hypothetical protein
MTPALLLLPQRDSGASRGRRIAGLLLVVQVDSTSTARCCFRSRVRAVFDAVRLRDGRR